MNSRNIWRLSGLVQSVTTHQELYQPAISKLVDFVVAAYQANDAVHLEVFVHKADTLSEEYKTGV